MAQTVPRQHPAVVLRSHYTHLRALLAVAMIAIAGLTAAVVVLAINDNRATSASSGVTPSVRSDGGPEESSVAVAVGSRPAAGPDESSTAAAIGRGSTQSTGGPAESTGRPDESRTAAAISGR